MVTTRSSPAKASNADNKRKNEDASPGKPVKQAKLEDTGVTTGNYDQDVKDVAAEAEAEEKGQNGHGANGQSGHQTNGQNGHEANGQNGHKTNGSKSNGSTPNPSNSDKINEAFSGKTTSGEEKSDPEKALKDSRGSAGLNSVDDKTQDAKDVPHDDVHAAESNKPASTSDFKDSKPAEPESTSSRAGRIPSTILERGIIYFFSRGRVGVESMDSVQDIQRSYFVLRPLAAGKKLADGPLDNDSTANRLLALPKKVWPKSPADKFMAFVEKAPPTTIQALKDEVFAGSTYSTATAGVRSSPPVTPVGEGVYTITLVGNQSHLAYMLTIPATPGELQTDLGIAAKSSFVISLKNPRAKGPANATLPQTAEFSNEIQDEFRGRSWMPVSRADVLDYANAQILMIGEDIDGHALDQSEQDSKDTKKETPGEELEKLEEEDSHRVEKLGKQDSDAVFEDLGLEKSKYPEVASTW